MTYRIWSNVTSPGFMSRIVQQANGTANPLAEIKTNKSPFSRSPNGHLKVGQLPVSTVPRRTPSSLISIPSPKRRLFLSPGRFSSSSRGQQDSSHTVFVRVAPVDLNGSAPPVVPMTPSPSSSPSKPGSLSFSSYNNNKEPSSPAGLGGTPQTALSQRFSRLWPNPTFSGRRSEAAAGGSGYQPSTSPVNNSVLEALASRKRYEIFVIIVDGI
jgi:hypothetical protein